MKTRLFVTLFIAFCLGLFRGVADYPIDTQAQLRAVTGNAKPIADSLLKAMDLNSEVEMKADVEKLIATGNMDLALAVLSDQQDEAKQAAALAFASIKTKRVAERLLAVYTDLDVAQRGGTEMAAPRRQAVRTFETILVQMTGAQVDSTQTIAQKAKIFADAVQHMPN